METDQSQQIALEIVYEAIDEVNGMLPADKRLDKDPAVLLAGDEGELDSLGLVSFIVAVEGVAQRRCGLELALSDQLESPEGPVTSIAALADYISEQASR